MEKFRLIKYKALTTSLTTGNRCSHQYKEEERKLIEKYGYASHINCVDFIVRTNLFKCFKNHTVEDIAAEVTVVDRKGNIKYPKVYAAYCPNCNKYFIQQSTYDDLKHWGIILHRITIQYSLEMCLS